MTDQTIERPSAEVAEIERHKYFLSERAGHDVGWEFAEQDWEANFAAAFRGEDLESPTDSDESKTIRVDAANADENTGFGKVLRRIFKRSARSKS